MASDRQMLVKILDVLEGVDQRLYAVERRVLAIEADDVAPEQEAMARLAKLGQRAERTEPPPMAMGDPSPGEFIQATPPPPQVQVQVREDAAEASFPEPPPEVRAEFERQAPQIFENWRPDAKKGWTVDKTEAAKAYAVAGPLWLAAYAHEFLMGLPLGFKQAMVASVAKYAPQDAIYLGRDILRQPLSAQKGRAYDVALEAADERWEEGRGVRA